MFENYLGRLPIFESFCGMIVRHEHLAREVSVNPALFLSRLDEAQQRLALEEAKKQTRTTVIYVETDREQRVGGYESWWDVPVAEASEMKGVEDAYRSYAESKKKERYFL